MTTEAAPPADEPHRLLSTAHELARRVRKDQRATWFPLLVFAALSFVAIPVRRYSGHHLSCTVQVCRAYTNADLVYWPVALVLAYVAIAWFYIRRSRERGIGTRVRPYAIAGIVIAIVLSAAAIWGIYHPGPGTLVYRLFSPAAAIGLALLVLAWTERNPALLLVTAVYLTVALVPVRFGPNHFDPPWYAAPVVSQGTVLLLAGLGFALVQRKS